MISTVWLYIREADVDLDITLVLLKALKENGMIVMTILYQEFIMVLMEYYLNKPIFYSIKKEYSKKKKKSASKMYLKRMLKKKLLLALKRVYL